MGVTLLETTEPKVVEELQVESQGEKDIYEAEGYVAICEEPDTIPEDEEEGYIDNGYMALPEEDPDEDTRTFVYPENYEEVASRKMVYVLIL